MANNNIPPPPLPVSSMPGVTGNNSKTPSSSLSAIPTAVMRKMAATSRTPNISESSSMTPPGSASGTGGGAADMSDMDLTGKNAALGGRRLVGQGLMYAAAAGGTGVNDVLLQQQFAPVRPSNASMVTQPGGRPIVKGIFICFFWRGGRGISLHF